MRVMVVMRNQEISVILKMLKIIKIFMRALYMMFSPLDYGDKYSIEEGNESVAEG